MAPRIIHLQPAAPAKPATGAACNGCGVCCAAEPCPLGMLLSRRRRGACAALEWHETETRYRCGALAAPARWMPWLPLPLARSLAGRWIAAGRGCDADLEAQPPAPVSGPTPGQP
ncbi:MAG: hypothetical protein ACKO3M_14910 [Rubrivivax sp.]